MTTDGWMIDWCYLCMTHSEKLWKSQRGYSLFLSDPSSHGAAYKHYELGGKPLDSQNHKDPKACMPEQLIRQFTYFFDLM